MPFDAMRFPRHASDNAVPAPLDLEAAFLKVPRVRRRDVGSTVLLRTADLDRMPVALPSWTVWHLAIGCILGAVGWVLIAWLAYSIGVDALHAIGEAMRHGAAEAAARGSW